MARALVPVAEGVEEMEAVIIVDVLRRAGWDVVSVGVAEGPVTASRGVHLVPDSSWSQVDPASFDMVVIPGGMGGTEVLLAFEPLLAVLREFHACGKLVAAICAGPLVLQAAGILADVEATSHPSVADDLCVCRYRDDRVVVAGNVVTSRGPGTALEFALAIVALVEGGEKARAIAEAMIAPFE